MAPVVRGRVVRAPSLWMARDAMSVCLYIPVCLYITACIFATCVSKVNVWAIPARSVY